LDQVKTLYPEVTQSARVTANAKPLTCRFEDGKSVEYATLLVHRGGAAQEVLGKDNLQLGLTNHPLPDVGQDAAYRLFQMRASDAPQLSAAAAVKDGWQVGLLFSKLPANSAPGQPNFAKAMDLLKAAVNKL
jgi:hypothetical protein